MEHPTLDTLFLTEDERRAARAQIQKMAYYKWQEAGCPADNGLRFWCEAELEWIEYYYVPSRREDQRDVRK